MTLRLIVIGAFCLAAGYGLHRLALWAEDRGWIYYRTKRMPPGAGGMAMMQVAAIFEPAVEHVVEERFANEIRADIAESGASGDDPATESKRSIEIEIPDPGSSPP